MKIKHLIYAALAVLMTACAKEPVGESPLRESLLGRRVNFQASQADPYRTRATYRHDGSFNEGEVMTIYRQYSNDAGISFDAATEAYRVYYLRTRYATGTSIALETDWVPKKGMKGHDPLPKGDFTQTEADSLTWENGKTVRFRSWSRSNLAGCIDRSATNKKQYYPDYSIAEWVTVSGPTLDISMTLKHQGCRIGFTTKSGNELQRAEICTAVSDYLWKDNSTDTEHDESTSEHGKTLAQAMEEAEAVQAVYERMCMPAGVDINTSLLTAMTKTLYDGTTDFSDISTSATGIVKYDTKTPDQIRDDVQRALFTSNLDGRLYMISIPYDMSTGGQKGETLILPACTRIRVWLYDVNDGDKAQQEDFEAAYHIFTLGDIKDNDGNTLFPEGMPLMPGVSYLFNVGYHYNSFTLTPADNFSWLEQDAESGTASDESVAAQSGEPYAWWKTAIKDAIPTDIETIFNPVFHISTPEQFQEFIALVNNTAAGKTSGLTQMLRHDGVFDKDHPATRTDYRWYKTEDLDSRGNLKPGRDSVTHAWAEEQGYIFYEHYHPANADQAAYSLEDYLRGAYSFFDEDLNRHFTVCLDNDLDLCDWKLTSVGKDADHPFQGTFEGGMHTLRNVYMDGGYLFKNAHDVAIRNLKVETVHNFMLLNTSSAKVTQTGYGAYIVGVSIKAPSSGNPIAGTLTGSSYVAGCIYEGTAGGAMVGTADNLYMYGNMMAAYGISGGALLGAYATGSSAFFAPQTAKKLAWGRFMVNYYDKTLSENTHAVGSVTDAYRPQEYIRGAQTYVLKAKNDNLLSSDVPYEKLTSDLMREGYYGLAPWKAMNVAIWQYNQTEVGHAHPCQAHYENDPNGYAHIYPYLTDGAPGATYGEINILELNN